MRLAAIVLTVTTVLALGARAGEPTSEVLLPLHENKDAWSPSAAFGKDVYLVVWQSGRQEAGEWESRRNRNLGHGER